MKFILGLILLLSSQGFAQSKSGSDSKPLFFQADRNGVRIVAQKFEYTLLDDQKIRVGDILIDASRFNFQLVREPTGANHLKFKWPAGLLTRGQLILLNNNGKAIWSSEVKENQIKISPMSSDYPQLRSELAEYNSPPIHDSLLKAMKFLPFMKFCISWRAHNTKIYLCSLELYLAAEGKELVVKDRKTTPVEASVTINGRAVTHQGIIFLNDKDENIFFRARTKSGSYLEIDTRMKEVDFKDLVQSEDGQSLIITASGAEPVQKKQVTILGEDLWRTTVPIDRPVLYLKGEGGIPMKQEFFIVGAVPKESLRPYTKASSPIRTYSSQESIEVLAPPGARLSSVNPANSLRPLGKNQFLWTLTELPKGEIAKHYLQVQQAGKQYQARYDIERGYPWSFKPALSYQAPSGILSGSAQLQRWWGQTLNPFRWGLQMGAEFPTNKKDGYPSYSEFRLELLHKFTSGFQLENSYWALSLPLASLNGDGISSLASGLSFWGFRSSPDFFPPWVQWYIPRITYLAGLQSSDIQFRSGIEISGEFLSEIKEQNFLSYGLKYRSYTFDPAPEEATSQIALEFGYQWIF